jgi:hypothetical protein
MAEFERVPLRPRPRRNWLPTAGAASAIFLVVVIVKPWDLARPATTGSGDATRQPTFYIRPTERTGPRDYDPRLFGGREPDPAWELWPAGYVVQFGLAGPVRVTGQGESPGPGSSGSAAPAGSGDPPASSAATTSPPSTEPPFVDHVVDLGPADHLVALGINTPLDARVASFRLFRVTDSRTDLVPVIRLPTLWESAHFIVIAPEDPEAAGQPAPWTPGAYRLELTTVFGEVRIVDLRIRPPLD